MCSHFLPTSTQRTQPFSNMNFCTICTCKASFFFFFLSLPQHRKAAHVDRKALQHESLSSAAVLTSHTVALCRICVICLLAFNQFSPPWDSCSSPLLHLLRCKRWPCSIRHVRVQLQTSFDDLRQATGEFSELCPSHSIALLNLHSVFHRLVHLSVCCGHKLCISIVFLTLC